MSFNYYVTAHKATAVSGSATGHFTAPDDLNLVVVKCNRIELYLVTPEGLKPHREIPVNGRICVVKFFRPQGETKDLLFFLTEKCHVAILEYTAEGNVSTRAFGALKDGIGRVAECGLVAIIDPLCRAIALRLYDGLLKLISLQKDTREIQAFNVRCEELDIQDLHFLHGCPVPTVVFLHQDLNGRHIKTYEVAMEDKELVPGPWKQDNVENKAHLLISVPEPCGGIVIIGQESITYHHGENFVAVAPSVIKQSTIVCYGQVDHDGRRYLIGDLAGRLFMLLLEFDSPMDDSKRPDVNHLKLEYLGDIAVPDTLTYLDNGVIFVGSRMGDSQLIRLSSERNEQKTFVTVLDTYTNLGPILDMHLVDLDRQGQQQLVTCSGAYKEGSLRIIRNGIGIQELASLDLPGIKGIWAIRTNSSEPDDLQNCLVVSFVGQTRTFLLVDEEVEATEITGMEAEEQSFFVGNLGKHILQITAASVRIVDGDGGGCLSSWKPPGVKSIGIASANLQSGQVVVACGQDLFYLEVKDSREVILVTNVSLEYQVSCLDISSISNENRSDFCAVGMWTEISVKLLHLPALNVVQSELLGGEIMPRSILLARFENLFYLLVGLGDGSLFYFQLDGHTGTVIDRKRISLGTKPTTLRPFLSHGCFNIFACSDRPAVIYCSNQKLVFSNVNLKEVAHITPLNTKYYPDSLAICDDQGSLLIGLVDKIQKLHIRTVPLGESPRRLAYQPETHTFGVLTFRSDIADADGQPQPGRPSASLLALSTSHSAARAPSASSQQQNQTAAAPTTTAAAGSSTSTNTTQVAQTGVVNYEGEFVDVHSFLLLDQHTFEVLHSHSFPTFEQVCSILSCKFGDDPQSYFVVGTAVTYPDESEARVGRLTVFQYRDSRLQVVHEKEIKGAPYSMALLNGKLLVGINSSVRLFEWTPDKEFRHECTHFNFTIALYVKTKGDFILCGDLMRSMCVLLYRPVESAFEEIARDYNPNWMTAAEILDDDTFLGAEIGNNLFVCQKDSAATTDDDRIRLLTTGYFYLGDMVNSVRPGSLVMQQQVGESVASVGNSFLLGSVQGMIGVVAQIPEKFYKFLLTLQQKLEKEVPSVGRIEHSEWRRFNHETRNEPMSGFIDGDLIESFLDLTRDKMSEIVIGLEIGDSDEKRPATVDDVVKVVEELTRIH